MISFPLIAKITLAEIHVVNRIDYYMLRDRYPICLEHYNQIRNIYSLNVICLSDNH